MKRVRCGPPSFQRGPSVSILQVLDQFKGDQVFKSFTCKHGIDESYVQASHFRRIPSLEGLYSTTVVSQKQYCCKRDASLKMFVCFNCFHFFAFSLSGRVWRAPARLFTMSPHLTAWLEIIAMPWEGEFQLVHQLRLKSWFHLAKRTLKSEFLITGSWTAVLMFVLAQPNKSHAQKHPSQNEN